MANFYELACQEAARKDTLFGICDDEAVGRAYTDTNQPNTWGATVKNERQVELTFTAVDKCLFQQGEYENVRRCDGMLTSDDHLYFIELKDQNKHWKMGAIEQLESTIKLFIEQHGTPTQRHRKAFACNRQQPRFQEIDNEQNLRFFRDYRFRIDAQAEIIVI